MAFQNNRNQKTVRPSAKAPVMKTAAKPKPKPSFPFFSRKKKKKGRGGFFKQDELSDTELLVLEDIDNGNEYYLAQIDRFTFMGREYVALMSYEPDNASNRDPEIVLMRFAHGEKGELYYQSIRSKQELDQVFETFFDRYINAG